MKIIKVDGEYFATFLDFKENIKNYFVKKSFDPTEPEVKSLHLDLDKNEINLHESGLNIYSPNIKLEPLHNIRHYYTIVLITDNGLEYPFYVDYNKLYSTEQESDIYYYNFAKPLFRNKSNLNYKFYIKGVYGDEHQLDLFDIKNRNEAFFKVPKKENLSSESYDIICEINNERFFRGPFSLLPKDNVSFVVDYQDLGENLKVQIRPKFTTCSLDKVSVIYKNEIVREEHRAKGDLSKIIRELTFYIPASGFNKDNSFKIKYSASESKVSEDNFIEKETTISFFEKKEELEIYNFAQEYSFDNDNLKISWSNKNSSEVSYKVQIGEKTIFTKDTFVNIENFSKMNNNQATMSGSITCSNTKKLISKNPVKLDFVIENKVFTHSSNLFTPVIDYSKTIYCNKPYGKLKWSTPSFKHYAKIKIQTMLNKAFLDEFSKPWLTKFILEDKTSEFDKVYTDYDKLYSYNFNDGKEISKNPNNATICYDITEGGWIKAENTNYIDVPLWFNSSGSKYKVFVELYDSFNSFVGKSEVEFDVIDNEIGDFGIENMRINRGQDLQFGEKGTVGEFFKIDSPRPIDVRNHYSSEFKTFLGSELTDKTNIDHNGKSLFYYMNTNEGDMFTINYNRTFNFYRVKIVIEKDGVQMHEAMHGAQGNEFENNKISIPKIKFKEEGEYKMKIQTFSSSGQASKIKEVSFFVHNEKPEKPFVRIKADDYVQEGEDITINKKYFEIEVTNNDLSQKYAGWKFKETHFFFRTMETPFLQFADYIIQTDVSDGSIVFKNNSPIENGDYECKIINYDYSGNASEPHVFKFKLRSEIKITPYSLYTNKPRQKMSWEIKKSQDSEGFFYFWRYSKDGITYNDHSPTKFESPYFPSNGDERNVKIDLDWMESNGKAVEGFYKLVCYEYSRKHPEGQAQYEFESPIVEVNEYSNPSNPIYSKAISGKVAVFNKGTNIEWSYASDLDDIVFETLHTEMVTDNPDTPQVEKMEYKVILIEPHKSGNIGNVYQAIIPQPSVVGNFNITEIATKAGVSDKKEGVWEIRFVTIDAFGNSNENRGYYTYFVSIVNRNPVINNATIANGNGSKYFGIYSDLIGYYIDYSYCYRDIVNYDEYKDKFPISNCDVSFIENPFNTQYTITVKIDDKSCISILSKLSENDKATHSRDGKYNALFVIRDPLNRLSQQVDRNFNIDTTTNASIFFINNNVFIDKVVSLKAVAVDKVKTVYYKYSELNIDKPEYDREEILQWEKTEATEIHVGENSYYGVELPSIEYKNDGYKTIYYAIEEDSGNLGEIEAYSFTIDSTNRLIPQFDYNNKIHFSPADEYVSISWKNTNVAVETFEVKLNKIKLTETGEIEITKSYAIQVDNISTIIPIGPEEETFVSLGGGREIAIKMDKDSVLMTGQYMLTVLGSNIYGTKSENRFIFQIDYSTPVDIAATVINNKITLDHNIITWESVRLADFYEVSYDGKIWIKTMDNKFFVNNDKLNKESDGISYIYLRWKAKSGVYSETSKIILSLSLNKLKKPKIEFFNDSNVTENNKIMKWIVTIEDPEVSSGIYYSFDKVKWHYKSITGRLNTIVNDEVEYPAADGVYDIFALSVDGDPKASSLYNKSELSHSFATVFASEIETPKFSNIENGSTLRNPVKLFIENKSANVRYYLYVNGKIVEEGYEISSSTYRKFNITCKAKKYGIEKIFDLITDEDNLHVWSLCSEPYIIDINNSQILVSIDHENTNMVIESTPSLTTKQVILFKEKDNEDSKWNIVKKGDTLTLLKEWEFRVSTITVI
ncbi:MAG: hypothetical protein ACRCZ2_01485 [Fusobacteriaceae bacterium]